MVLLMLPGLVCLLLFVYVPLLGNVAAFQQYEPFLGFRGSPFVGFANFTAMLEDPAFWNAFFNTIEITALQLILFFPAPILLAIAIHSLMSNRVRRLVQSVVYLPHFISWVIVVAIVQHVLGGAGVLNQLFRDAGLNTFNVFTPTLFKPLMVGELMWKETGWGTIIYLAALTNIDVTLYEAAAVDGAGKWRRHIHVTLPGLKGVTILLFILQLGATLTVGFEQILLQRDYVGPGAAEVLQTYVYYNGIVAGNWGEATAVGLVSGVVGAILVFTSNRIAHAFGEAGVYQ
jgi:putative aldouronate transport system permease protein